MSRYLHPEVETLPRSCLKALQLELLRKQIVGFGRKSLSCQKSAGLEKQAKGSLPLGRGDQVWRL